jgi:hypothetical protein
MKMKNENYAASESCPHCNGWGIEPNDDLKPCRAGCKKSPYLGMIQNVIKNVCDEDLFSSENTPDHGRQSRASDGSEI